MRIYVAGSSKEIDRCERMIAAVRALGHEITFDWAAHVRAAPGGANAGSDEELGQAAALCREGAVTAQLVWVLQPHVDKPTAGAWSEMMIGYELGVRVWISPSSKHSLVQRNVMAFLPGVVRFEEDADALAELALVRSRET